MKPGDYKVEAMVKVTLNVSDITQEEIDKAKAFLRGCGWNR